MLRICFAPWVEVQRVRNLEAYVFLSLGFSRKAGTHVLVIASSTSDWRPSVQAASHQYRRVDRQAVVLRWKHGSGVATTSSARRGGRDYERKVSGTVLDVLSGTNLANAIQTKAAFSYAMIVDRVGGWRFGNEEGSQIGPKFAAWLWIYTKVVVCNGQKHMETVRINRVIHSW